MIRMVSSLQVDFPVMFSESINEGLLYNLYGDKELNLGLVPQTVYDMQSDFYATIFQEYGVPLDTRADYADRGCIFCLTISVLLT